MRIFLDTNILMDAVENRKYSLEAHTILNLCSVGIFHCCASTMSFATLSYLLRHFTKERLHETFKHLSGVVEVVTVGVEQFESALDYGPVGDFEDLLQYKCAVAAGCDMVITNDKKDFLEFNKIPVMSSPDFLVYLAESNV